jgi:PAS domain S-box-containing protein
MVEKDFLNQQSLEFIEEYNSQKFKWFFENSPIGISITKITDEMFVNQTFAKMLGYSISELSSMKWQEITHPDDIQLCVEITKSIIENKQETATYKKRYITKEKNIIWAEIITSLFRDKNNNPICFFTNILDINE